MGQCINTVQMYEKRYLIECTTSVV